MNYAAPIYTHPSWTAASFGGGDLRAHARLVRQHLRRVVDDLRRPAPRPARSTRSTGDAPRSPRSPTLPNNGPAFGNINYDCVSETIRVSSHEDCRIYQLDMERQRSAARTTTPTGDVTMGAPADPGEPDGVFCPLGERMWAVQSHYGKHLLQRVVGGLRPAGSRATRTRSGRSSRRRRPASPTARTAKLEATIPGLQRQLATATRSPTSASRRPAGCSRPSARCTATSRPARTSRPPTSCSR